MWLAVLLACACSAAEEPEGDGGSTGSQAASESTGEPPPPATEDDGDDDTSEGGESSDGPADDESSDGGAPVDPTVLFPRTSITADELAVVVNDDDPLSVEITEYYVEARGIPEDNVFHVSLPLTGTLTEAEFMPVRDALLAELPDTIQAVALTFVNPYRVGCMSITSALTFGYGPQWCGGCAQTAPSTYYDSDTLAPWTDLQLRPTMMIAATTIEDAMALIDRGIASDGTHPEATAYAVRTTDAARSVRFRQMESFSSLWEGWDGLSYQYIDNHDGDGSNLVEEAQDVMFYFTGLANVGGIDTNTYLPGAIADHLTSFGGQVPESSQMSAIEWLRAGATASFGTVVEPCAQPEKFPHVQIATTAYFRGETLIEAYWKSVRRPGEGLFMGEPLARPWDGSTYEMVDGDLVITTNLLIPGKSYAVEKAPSEDGPWEYLGAGSIPATQTFELVIENPDAEYYRLRPED